MRINEAIDFFENELSRNNSKKETKIFERFLRYLVVLEDRGLSEMEKDAIEIKLASFDLSADAVNFRKKLTEFDTYLREELKLVTKGYYAGMGIALGTAFGVSLGTALGSVFSFLSMGIAMGISIGLSIGLVIGKSMDDKAEKENRILAV